MADPLAQTVFNEGDASVVSTVISSAVPSLPDSGGRVVAGRYEILGLVGAGGMGNVYRARDRELEEVVALKVLRPQIAGNAAALERFRREVKLSRRVTHPNVARVFDIGDEGGEKYLTMELVDGEALGALVARGERLPVARAVAIAVAVCAGLDAAHKAGVVHRDLKPDNVLLARDGRVVVTDFGIARAAASTDTRITGAIVGTPAYMAPEQVEGSAVDARTDIYALGAMLYEILTGEPPWHGDSVLAIAAARLLHPPPDARVKRPDLPPALAAVILRCMARQPDERYPSADAVARALELVAASTPVLPVPVAAAHPAPDPLALARAPAGRKDVAVLPFRNVGHRDQEHVADGLTEDLIDLLSMASGLRVRSRGMVMRYRGVERDPREIGRELDVPVVVEGSVRRENGAVRVSVRLVSVADGMQIWHKRFDRPEAELFAVSDAAARAISEALAVELSAPARCCPNSAEAVDLYLRARSSYMRYFTDLNGESLDLYERAVALAPDDPRILAGYAMAMGRLWTGGREQTEVARRAAESAVERAPGLPDSHVALAMIRYHERREPETILELKRALSLQPLNPEAHDLMGRVLGETALQEQARKHLETALMLEPEFQLSRTMLARVHMLQGDFETARAVLAAGPTGTTGVMPAAARMCLWTRDDEGAKRLAAEQVGREESARGLTRLILDLMVKGTLPYDRVPDPAAVSHRLGAFLRQMETECALYLGDEPRALAAIEKADAAGVFDVAWADGCPLLAPLREHERFHAARAGIAARAAAIAGAYLTEDA